MGTYINLKIGDYCIDFGANENYRSHSILFKNGRLIKTDYHYYDKNENLTTIKKDSYSIKLSELTDVLQLLGYNLDSLREDYEKKYNEYKLDYEVYNDEYKQYEFNFNLLEYDSFISLFRNLDFNFKFKDCTMLDSFVIQCISSHYETSFSDESFYNAIDCYYILLLLSENSKFNELDLIWEISDLIESGYASLEDFSYNNETLDKFLIVTEGNSDTCILKKAFEILTPNINHFFDFIDMKVNYPFSGVGNMTNFYKGLLKVKPNRKIIFLFDNDTAGVQKYNECIKIKNGIKQIKLICLPDLPEFDEFNTKGPHGSSICNINRRAVAIECFLDFKQVKDTPTIIWKSYIDSMDEYQGELLYKEQYSNKFYGCTDINNYDTTKLQKLIQYIINVAKQ
ncbi:MAG: HEPN/Toprim-associated domain-containing protein [Peptostreptococcaceae bacterium]